jgi:uncharacterized protein YjbI with pentapeptide repeats
VAQTHNDVAPPRLPSSLMGPGPPGPPRGRPELADDAELSMAEVSGDFSSRSGRGAEINQCRVVGAVFTSADLARARVVDTIFVGCDLSGTSLIEANLRRVELRDCRALGATLAQAQLHDVKLTGCKLDGADFRMCSGQRVHFEDCSLAQADFYAARLDKAAFLGCDLTAVDFSKAKLPAARLHGSTLAVLKGAQYLTGAVISSAQIVPMAMQMFAAFGLTVDDELDL